MKISNPTGLVMGGRDKQGFLLGLWFPHVGTARFSRCPTLVLAGGEEASTLKLGPGFSVAHLSTVEQKIMLTDKIESQQRLVWPDLAFQGNFGDLRVQEPSFAP